jgi:hypothetical protein
VVVTVADDKTKVFSAMRARTQENIARQKAEEYTPTTDSIREGYAFTVQSKIAGATFGQGLAEFDRWLGAHDEAVRADMQPREVEVSDDRRERVAEAIYLVYVDEGGVDGLDSFTYPWATRTPRVRERFYRQADAALAALGGGDHAE